MKRPPSFSPFLSLSRGAAELAAFVCMAASCVTSSSPDWLELEPTIYAGTVLSGPWVDTDPEEIAWDSSWIVDAHVAYVVEAPRYEEPVRGRLVLVRGTENVFQPRAELASGVRRGGPDERLDPELARSWEQQEQGALPPGATVSLTARHNAALEPMPTTAWEGWTLEISRSAEHAGEVQVALALEGTIRVRDEDDEEAPGMSVAVTERMLLAEPPSVGGAPLRLLFPAPGKYSPRGAYVVEVALLDAPEKPEERAAIVEHSREDLLAERTATRADLADIDPSERFRLESQSAVEALRRRELRRPALLFLAQGCSADITAQLALTASPESLGEFLNELAQRSEAMDPDSPSIPDSPSSMGWFLERSTWLWMTGVAQDEKRELPFELVSLLTRNTGELGRYPDLLEEAVRASRDGDVLAGLVQRENLAFLEDAHPAARVRAYDWLASKDAVPANYDPLASRDERRAALSAALSAAQAAQNTEGEQ